MTSRQASDRSAWRDSGLCAGYNGRRIWRKGADGLFVNDCPAGGVDPTSIGLPREPGEYKPLEGVKPVDRSPEGFCSFMDRMGDQCGRDTSDENLLTMVETARTYGRYA